MNKPNKNGGRPTVLVNSAVRILERAFMAGLTVTEACNLARISRSTFYDNLNSNPEFSDKIMLAKDWLPVRAKMVVAEAIEAGNASMAKWWLQRRLPAEFGAPSHIPTDAAPVFILSHAERESLTKSVEAAVHVLERD